MQRKVMKEKTAVALYNNHNFSQANEHVATYKGHKSPSKNSEQKDTKTTTRVMKTCAKTCKKRTKNESRNKKDSNTTRIKQ